MMTRQQNACSTVANDYKSPQSVMSKSHVLQYTYYHYLLTKLRSLVLIVYSNVVQLGAVGIHCLESDTENFHITMKIHIKIIILLA